MDDEMLKIYLALNFEKIGSKAMRNGMLRPTAGEGGVAIYAL